MILYDEQDKELIEKYTWHIRKDGYVCSSTCKTKTGYLLMHRFVMKAMDGELIDHINGNKSDNRRQNLRKANKSINGHNSSKPMRSNKLGIRGVSKNRNRFQARIVIDGKIIYLGSFKTSEEAKHAYEAKRKEVLSDV